MKNKNQTILGVICFILVISISFWITWDYPSKKEVLYEERMASTIGSQGAEPMFIVYYQLEF